MSIELSRTALYFPEIEVPEQWAKQTLLYMDEVASICPGSLDEVLEGDVSPHMRELCSTPFYRTVDPVHALHVGGNGIFEEFATALLSPKIRTELQENDPVFSRAFVPVHHRKMDAALRDLLLETEYATPIQPESIEENEWLQSIEQRDDWLLIRDDVSRIYMDILARRAASFDSGDEYGDVLRDTTASTDHKLHRDLAFGVRKRMPSDNDTYAHFALGLHLLLPAPAPDTSIGQILEFRSRYDEDVPRLRLLFASFEEQLSEADSDKDVTSVVSSFSDTVSEGLRELHCNLGSFGVDFTTGSLTTLLSLKAPEVLETLAKGHGLGNIIEEYPVECQGVALAVAGIIGFGVAVATRRRRKHHALESSPFSYLYRVQQELQ